MKPIICYFYYLLATICILKADFLIEGNLILDNTWEKAIYLSAIPSFDEMYTASDDMIVFWTEIDSSGYFRLSGDFLPEEDQLYRLHISLKGDPVSTIMIGGKNQNFTFFIANNHSQIFIQDTSKLFLLNDAIIEGGNVNQLMQEVNHLVAYAENTIPSDYPVGRQFVKLALKEKLKQFADTCSHPLLSLYALYQSDFDEDLSENPLYYQSFAQKWETEGSEYFDNFKSRIPDNVSLKSSPLLVWLSGLLGLIIGFFLYPFIQKLRKKLILTPEKRFQQLSIQERKIFALLQKGKSNKEISHELNIELSTVKSHVSSVYAKLKIKSRKEAANFLVNR